MKNTIIGLKELRENVETYASEAKKGRSFLVMRRSQPLFKISPPDEADDLWETVVDFTKFYKDGVSAGQLLKKLRSLNGQTR